MALFAVSSYAWELVFDDTVAGATNKENDLDGFDGEWNGFYTRGRLTLAEYDGEGIEGEFHGAMFFGVQGEETWEQNGNEIELSMNFWGVDVGADIGWALPISIPEMKEITFVPLVGYRWRFMRIEREDDDSNRNNVDIFANIVNLGARISVKATERLEVFVKPIFGIPIYHWADPDNLDSAKGLGGFLFDFNVGLDYLIREDFLIGFTFTAETQRLKFSDTNNVNWSDNALSIVGGTFRAIYKF